MQDYFYEKKNNLKLKMNLKPHTALTVKMLSDIKVTHPWPKKGRGSLL